MYKIWRNKGIYMFPYTWAVGPRKIMGINRAIRRVGGLQIQGSRGTPERRYKTYQFWALFLYIGYGTWKKSELTLTHTHSLSLSLSLSLYLGSGTWKNSESLPLYLKSESVSRLWKIQSSPLSPSLRKSESKTRKTCNMIFIFLLG